MPETRKSPEIPSGMIGQSVAVGAALGVESVRQLDQALRQKGVRRGIGSEREAVASDTTVLRVCGKTRTAWARKALKASWRWARGQGLLGQEVAGRTCRVGAIDGSTQGGVMMSVLVEAGQVAAPMCVGRIPKRGKELPVSLAVLRHMAKAERKGFLTHLLVDGLYADEPFFATCEDIGTAGVVKLKAEEADRLLILKDARGLFNAPRLLPGVEYAEGLDEVRGCFYQVWAVAELPWSTTERRLKVARIRERWLKGPYKGQTLEFWVISQDQTLEALSLRELGHMRWFIENNVFKASNEQAHTKHVFSRRPRTALVINALQMVGMLWVSAWRHALAALKVKLKSFWDHGTFPMRWLRRLLWSTLNLAEADTG